MIVCAQNGNKNWFPRYPVSGDSRKGFCYKDGLFFEIKRFEIELGNQYLISHKKHWTSPKLKHFYIYID